MNPTIDGLGDADVTQKNGEKLARHIESKGVDAKHMEESGPARLLLNIDDIHQESLKQGGEATGDHHIAGTPDALVEGETVREQIATNDEDGAHHEEGDDFIRDRFFLADKFATIETKQHMGNRRDGAQQALRINRALMIKMVVAEEIEVDLRQDVDAGILGIAVAKDKNGSIDNKEANDHRDGVLMVTEQGEERHDAVAEGDALHDGPDAEMTKAKEITLDGVVKPVDEEADSKEQHRTLDNATNDLGGGFELGLHQGEVARDTHNEEEEGKDEVAGSHAVPLGVLEHLERLAPAIINQYHSGDGNATENIET